MDCLDGRIDLGEFTYKFISLISKISQPEQVSQFRPISLYNVIYKIASKTLTNRLKVLLPCIVSKNQSAFVLRSLISDNVIVAHEVTHYLYNKRHEKVGYFVLKLDVFISSSTVKYLVLINGNPRDITIPLTGLC